MTRDAPQPNLPLPDGSPMPRFGLGTWRMGEGRSWRLIESLASEIAGMVVADFGVAHATVEVKKFILPEARHVSVRTTR